MARSLRFFVVALLTALVIQIQAATDAPPELESETDFDVGYLIVTPKTFIAETTERICVTLHNMSGPIELSIKLFDNTTLLSKLPLQFLEFRMGCYDLQVPAIEEETMEATLVIKMRRTLVTQDGFEVVERRLITIQGINTEMFIETDKPVYKPGQTVKFRILNLNQDLKPDLTPVTKVWIESPAGVRVQQWRNQEGPDGLIDLEMPMTPDPDLGTWTIHATHRGREHTKSFEVDEYVLPKFEIIITPPSFIMINETRITVSICGRYTYGQPVRGSFRASVTVLSEGWNSRERRTLTFNEEDTGTSGCSDVTVPVFRFELNSTDFSLWNARLSVEVDYTETSSGVTLSGRSESSKVTRDALLLQFDAPNVFKPGVPFHGKILVTYPDGSPAPNKLISMSCNSDQGKIFEKNYTSPENGAIDFSVTDINITATSLNLYAFAPGFTVPAHEKFGRHRQYTLHDPATSLYVRPQYSPSGSFLQLAPITGTVAVGSEQVLTIHYTARSPSDNIRFRFVVMSRGNIIPTRMYGANRRGRRQAEGEEEIPEGMDVPSLPSDLPSMASPDTGGSEDMPSIPSDLELPSGPSSEGGEGGFPGSMFPGSMFPVGSNFASGSHSFSSAFSFVPPTDPPVVIVEPGELYTRALKFHVTHDMVPETRILAYYIRTDGEVVADSTAFKVEKTFENEVNIAFRDEERMPGAETQIQIQASPGSLCAVGVVDRSVHILGGDNQLKPDKIFRSLDRYQLSSAGGYLEPSERCKPDEDEFPQFFPLGRRRRRSVFLPGYGSRYQDSSRAFMNMGLIYITNMDVETSPCIGGASTDKISGGAGGGQEGPIALPILVRAENNIELDDILEKTDIASGALENAPRIRSYFPETWLWDLRRTDATTGETSITMEVPDTVTEWIGSGFCTSQEFGVGVSPPTKLRAFQPFFLSYTLPYSVIRGEVVPVRVTVFNYLTESLVVEVSLERTDDFTMAKRSRNRQRVCVGGSQSQSVEFRIIPSNLGAIQLEALGLSVNDRDALCGNELVSSQLGARDIIIKELLVEAEGTEVETNRNCYTCPNETDGEFTQIFNVTLPASTVPGSARGKISVTGDLMGPSLSNLDHLIQLPTGCGEQNMLGFVPNIVALSYLNTTDQLTRSIENKASFNMKRGYQRELNYRHRDGSYSAFGENDPEGSTWLTAFVVRSFAQASEFIYIDDKDLDFSISWLKSLQDPETGCFESKGKVLHKGMKGGVDNKRTLTSYVLLSMLEAGLSTNDSVVADALACVTRDLDAVDDTYALAQMAYTLTLANSSLRDDVMERLEVKAITDDGLKYWQSNRSPSPQPYDYYSHQAPSLDIEITSYVLLASLAKVEEASEAIAAGSPIARWIILQRNSNGGFSSTQDTVVALHALSEYAKVAYSDGTSIDATATVTPLKGTDEPQQFTFELNNLNRLVLQEEPFSVFPSQVTLSGTGSGCALIQVTTIHNEIPELPSNAGFDVDVLVLEAYEPVKGERCTEYYMKVCARYLIDDDESNMAIILVKMVSGYYPDKTSLRLLQKQHKPLQRFELDGKNIYFYFNELTSEETCLVFKVTKEIDVTDAKDGVVEVYDYYDKDIDVKKMYNIECPVDPPSWAASLLFTVPVETIDGQPLSDSMRPLPFIMEALRNVDGLPLIDPPGPELGSEENEVPSEREPPSPEMIEELGPPDVFILCPAGQKFVDGLRRCIPINGCASSPCLEGQNCIDTDAGFLCVGCMPGYRKGDANLCVRLPDPSVSLIVCGPREELINGACTSINECVSNPCPQGARCVDTRFGHSCEPVQCPPGFELTDDLRCKAIDACDSNPCNEGETCTSTANGYNCTLVECLEGYQMNENNTCVDINECETLVEPCGGPEYICHNDQGSYLCECVEGYTMDQDGYCMPQVEQPAGECPASNAEVGDCGLLIKCFSDDVCGEGQRCCAFDECGTRCFITAPTLAVDPPVEVLTCPESMEYRICGSGCGPAICGQDQPEACPAMCRRGCYCPEGLMKDFADGLKCVTPDQCPETGGGGDGGEGGEGGEQGGDGPGGEGPGGDGPGGDGGEGGDPPIIDRGGIKPGICPLQPEGELSVCGPVCVGDEDCSGADKCCQRSCGMTCVTPVQTIIHTGLKPPVINPGLCPEEESSSDCDGTTCIGDQDCLGSEKCCYRSCGSVCIPSVVIEPDPLPVLYIDKPGMCPPEGEFGVCGGTPCEVDIDCPGADKCCERSCGKLCVPSIQIQPPIDPLPVVSIVKVGMCPPEGEFGVCGGTPCVGDQDCPGADKCCERSCGKLCVPSIQIQPPIDPLPVDPLPVVSVVKPGMCPPQGEFGVCGGTPCVGDQDCPGADKCCERSCGKLCVPSIQIQPVISVDKPGVCPPQGEFGVCGGTPCEGDHDCPGSDKCCERSCGKLCVPTTLIDTRLRPPIIKPGMCPPEGSLSVCGGTPCVGDQDCDGGDKCCHRSCGSVCTPAIQIQPLPPVMPILPKPHGGYCPYVAPNDLGYCEGLDCTVDSDCVETSKCCGSACGYHCTPSVATEPQPPVIHVGECPPVEAEGYCEGAVCQGDGDCDGTEKCCVSSCGYHCTPALQVDPLPNILECEGDLVFTTCGSMCEDTCGETEPEGCADVCLAGCSCPEGTIRAFSGATRCVPRGDCPEQPPPPPEPEGPENCTGDLVFNECGTACPLTCDEPEARPCTRQCVRACFCPSGTFRVSADGDECVSSVDDCPAVTCEEKRRRLLEGGMMLGRFVPQCTQEGKYQAKQCHGSTGICWCADQETGVKVPGTDIHVSDGEPNCEEVPLSCAEKRSQLLEGEGPPLLGQYVPQCTEEGQYRTKQCHGSTGFCWCADQETGVKVPGTDVHVRDGEPNCEEAPPTCAEKRSQLLEGRPLPGQYVPQCTEEGQYRTKQCHSSTGFCWCADQETGVKVPGTDVHVRDGEPNCEEDPSEVLPNPEVFNQCPPGKVFADGVKKCVPQDRAEVNLLECSEGLVYNECGSPCPQVCNEPEAEVCITMCQSGCFCPEGQIRVSADSNECVATREDCPAVISPGRRTEDAPPRIIKQPESQIVIRGDPVTLNCRAEGRPTPEISWLKDGQPLIIESDDPRRSLLSGNTQLFFLQVEGSRRSGQDGGVYQCVATNSLGVVRSNNATLDIASPVECGGDLVYNECGPTCPDICNEPEAEGCVDLCVSGCFCPAGQIKLFANSEICVATRDDCPPPLVIPPEITCPEGLVVKECGAECDPFCNDEAEPVCQTICRAGCGCPDNLVRMTQGSTLCIPREQCPSNPGEVLPNPEVFNQCPPGKVFADGVKKCVPAPRDCEEGLVFNECGSSCEPYCGEPSDRLCVTVCVSGCFCPEGHVRVDEGSDMCIPQEDCPVPDELECTGDLVSNECGPPCEDICNQQGSHICIAMCVRGCFCPEGQVRVSADSNECVASWDDCPPSIECVGDLVYKECGSECDPYCNDEREVCQTVCSPGCGCPDNMIRLTQDSTECVEQCPEDPGLPPAPAQFQCPAKIGTCPFFLAEREMDCQEQCSEDFDCEGDRKCCRHACGSVCYYPDFPVAQPDPSFPEPVDPPIDGIQVQTCPAPDITTLVDCTGECTSDEECGEGEKCCRSDGCDANVCQSSVEETRCVLAPCPVYHDGTPVDLEQKVCGSDFLIIVKVRSDGRVRVLDDMRRYPNPYTTRRPIVSLIQDSQCPLEFVAEKRYIIFARGSEAIDMFGKRRIQLDHTTMIIPMSKHKKDKITDNLQRCAIA